MKPKRGSVRAIFSVEDMARLPGLEDALRRDLRAALMDSIDKAIFRGDLGTGDGILRFGRDADGRNF